MVVVRIMGGIGNQMFQYAFGLLLKSKTKYDISWFQEVKDIVNATQREYELDFWNITPTLVNGFTIFGFIKRKCHIESPHNVYNDKLLKIKTGVIEGYFQVAKYYEPIRNKLLNDFVPKNEPNVENQKILDLIHSTNSVSIHVRRGDYVKLQHIHGLCDLDYYKRAVVFVAKHVNNPYFFIFSDDVQWVADNLKIDFSHIIVDINHGRDAAWDIWLMANCKHNIIANSSFSWWGAWLNQNPNKIVVAPLQWFADGRKTDVVPIEWQRI